MQNTLRKFQHEEFGYIRVFEIGGLPWFVGTDVATALGYENPRDALARHVDSEDRDTVVIHDGIPGNPNRTVINESGLYSLILSSKLASAKRFKRWVTSEVLPSIRRHGAYITDEVLDDALGDPDLALKLFQKLRAEQSRTAVLTERVEALAPKARYCDTILQCKNAVPVSLIAKDYGLSATAFNRLLHGLDVQYRLGSTWLLYQKFAGRGYTQTRTYHAGGTATLHTCWTQKGRLFLFDRLAYSGIYPLSMGMSGILH